MKLKRHSRRNMAICLLVAYLLFLVGSTSVIAVMTSTLPGSAQYTNSDRVFLVMVLSAFLTSVITSIAVPLGFGLMFVFGGIFSTRAVRLYLLVMRGKHILVTKPTSTVGAEPAGTIGIGLGRQIVYWLFILSVIVSFVTYLSKRRIPITITPSRPSEISGLITKDFVLLTLVSSIIIPVVTLSLPYFGNVRLRSIDVGPFHTSVLTTTIGVSGGFSLLYAILTRPEIRYFAFYVLLFTGVCWCFALGCNLAFNPVEQRVSKQVLSKKSNSRLLTSKIWLEGPQGSLVEA